METALFEKMERTKEENAIVLDFLPNGYPLDERPMYMKTPVAQAIGREHFILLELVPKKDIAIASKSIVSNERNSAKQPYLCATNLCPSSCSKNPVPTVMDAMTKTW